MIFSTSGSNAGLGFAVPVDTVKRIAPQLIKYKKVIRPGLGIGVLTDEIRERFFDRKGAAISFVDPDGAASKAGLKGIMKDRYGRIFVGDIITKIEGKKINSKDDIFHELEKFEIGDTVKIEFFRKNKKKQTKITLKQL